MAIFKKYMTKKYKIIYWYQGSTIKKKKGCNEKKHSWLGDQGRTLQKVGI
jgi:hypothetical protein